MPPPREAWRTIHPAGWGHPAHKNTSNENNGPEPVERPHAATRAPRAPGLSVLAPLGVVAFCIMMGEGALADWSAVYLRSVRNSAEGVAAIGYAAFSVAMATGRFCGDALVARFGSIRVVRLGGSLAAVGMVWALLGPGTLSTMAGFAGVGLGFSVIIPIVFSAAGRVDGIAPSVALASVTTTGYLGFLLGPPLIGFASEQIGLPGALGLIAGTSLAAVGFARKLGSAARTTARPARPSEGIDAPLQDPRLAARTSAARAA